jgi:hypothetical protein
MMSDIQDVSVNVIRADGGTQSRAELDSETIEEYRGLLVDGGWPFPAVVAFYDGATYWLADGFHRLYAALRVGRFEVPCDVRQGTQRDAVLYGAGANATHGLRRTNADKRRAVRRLLEDEEWGRWSDREIARWCRVSHPFVAGVRREVGEVTGNVSSERVYQNKHGETAIMETGNIGRVDNNEPDYVFVWQLELHVREWLEGVANDLFGGVDALLDIKERRVGWGRSWSSLLQAVDRRESAYRKNDLRQACNNVLDQEQQKRKVELPSASVADIEAGVRAWCAARGEEVDVVRALLDVTVRRENATWHDSLVKALPGPRYRGDTVTAVRRVLAGMREEASEKAESTVSASPNQAQTGLVGDALPSAAGEDVSLTGGDSLPAGDVGGRRAKLEEMQRELERMVVESEPPMVFLYNKAAMAVDDCIEGLKNG